MRKHLYVIIPMLIALALRLYPTLITGLPFSTDAWAPIKNTELLLDHTPIPLNHELFDGYNNYWPANTLFGAAISLVTSIQPMQAMAIFLPVTGAVTILLFYTLIRKIYRERTAFIASIIFGTASTHAIFTAGVTKETYANPLYILLILIFLHPKINSKKRILLFTITSATLISTHHLTSFITIALLFSLALARLINNLERGGKLNTSDFALTGIFTLAAFLYFELYAKVGWVAPLANSEVLSVASYMILAFASAAYLKYKVPMERKRLKIIATLSIVAIILLLTFLTIKKPAVSENVWSFSIPEQYLLYISPFIISLSLIILGHSYLKRFREVEAPLFWLASIIGLYAYVVCSKLFQGSQYRFLNFIHPPLAIISAAALSEPFNKNNRRKIVKIAAITIVLTIAILNIFSMQRIYTMPWLYRRQEFTAATWIAAGTSNPTIAGDVKVAYLLKDYFHSKVDLSQGLQYLTGTTVSPPQLFFTYKQNLENGYALYGGQFVSAQHEWRERVDRLNLLYSNGLAAIYAG